MEDLNSMKKEWKELCAQWLETEIGGVQVYETALKCVINEDLKEEWTKYLEETQNHVQIVSETLTELGMDPAEETPGRAVCRHIGQSLVQAMELALQSGPPEAAQLVAAECVVHAETKDHMNWHLVKQLSEDEKGEGADILAKVIEEFEEQEDEHLYHSKGWARELWIESLGLPAVLPPPEEEKDVKTAIGAARAEHARQGML